MRFITEILKTFKGKVIMSDEQAIEREIQEKGLNAPRVNPEDIDDIIAGETFTRLPSGKKMVCEITIVNGFTVIGESSVVSKENFNEAIGRKISRKHAREKIWEIQGYLLQQRLYEKTEKSRDVGQHL